MTRSTSYPGRRLHAAFGAILACALALAAAGTAQAASPYACVAAGGEITTGVDLNVAFAGDFPDVVVGRPFPLQPTVNYNLGNDYLVHLGESGVLADGENNLGGMTFWVTIAATNTVEGRQTLRATVNPSANTRVIWDADAASASVQRYSGNPATPSGPPTDNLAGTATLNSTGISWTPTSTAPISFSVAPAGTLGQVAVSAQWRRNNDTAAPPAGDVDPLAATRPYGNVLWRLRLGTNAPSEGRTSLDCVHGSVYVLNDTIAYSEAGNVLPADGGDRGRYTVLAGSPPSFATVTPEAAAKPFQCVDGLGRYLQREINGYDIVLRAGATGTYTAGAPYTLSGVQVDATIGSAMIKGLYSNLYNYQSLPADGKLDQPFDLWLAIQGANTVEGVQFVQVDSRWQAEFVDPDGVVGSGDERFPASEMTYTVPTTTWTPAGPGPISFSLAAPGQIPTLTLVGRGHSGDAGAVFPMNPYGSAFIRAETGRYGASIDCLEGKITIADPSIAFSNLGRLSADILVPRPVPAGEPIDPTDTVPAGSGGRYAIDHQPAPPFAIVPAPAVPSGPPPVVDPPVVEPPVASAALRSSSLKVRRSRVGISIRCSTGAGPCTGRVVVRTARKVRPAKGKARRVVQLTRSVRYRVPAGTTATVRPRLTAAARKLLPGSQRLQARIVATPSSGDAVTRAVPLRR